MKADHPMQLVNHTKHLIVPTQSDQLSGKPGDVREFDSCQQCTEPVRCELQWGCISALPGEYD